MLPDSTSFLGTFQSVNQSSLFFQYKRLGRFFITVFVYGFNFFSNVTHSGQQAGLLCDDEAGVQQVQQCINMIH